MAGKSRKSRLYTLRLENEVADILERRAGRQGRSVQAYLRERVVFDTKRKHGRKSR